MMKRVLSVLAVAAGVLSIAACSKVQEPAGAAATVSFRVSIDNPSTKVSYTDQSATNPELPIKLAWEAGDQLSVLILNNSGLGYADDGFEGRAIYNFTTAEGGAAAEFTGTAPRALEDGEYYMVVYPAICNRTVEVFHASAAQFSYEESYNNNYLNFATPTQINFGFLTPSEMDSGILMTACLDGDFGTIEDVVLQHQTGILKIVIQKPSILTGNYLLSDIYAQGFPWVGYATFDYGKRLFMYNSPMKTNSGTILKSLGSFPDDGFTLYYPTGELNLTGSDSFDLIINKTPLLDSNQPSQYLDQKKLVLNVTLPDGVAISVTPGNMFTLTIGADAPWTQVDYE